MNSTQATEGEKEEEGEREGEQSRTSQADLSDRDRSKLAKIIELSAWGNLACCIKCFEYSKIAI